MNDKEGYTLNETTRNNIANDLRCTSFSEILDMDAMSLDRHIEQQIGKRLDLSIMLGNLMGRGSLYTYFNRLLSREWIDRQLSRIR